MDTSNTVDHSRTISSPCSDYKEAVQQGSYPIPAPTLDLNKLCRWCAQKLRPQTTQLAAQTKECRGKARAHFLQSALRAHGSADLHTSSPAAQQPFRMPSQPGLSEPGHPICIYNHLQKKWCQAPCLSWKIHQNQTQLPG